ncbi:hypothetical protein DSL72_006121 [Monilinia vaccinii-corymbosi]|uniref:USP domain-containing protein n=1 Tax=Monilinia vaccinii-corymbosi TaxID=61207 RepID=A0A8A3PGV4_9HELO|nr:hypothetical protein DSL72_006121 [Monilinia vaccinii-corymbosi]
MATKVFKMYRTSSFQSFDSSNYSSYHFKDSFQYNPRSLLTKNPRYNKLYSAYFANSMSSRRRYSSRIRKMNSPARSASSISSSSSSSGSRSKSSVSPPPGNSSSSAPLIKTSVSPPLAKALSSASPPPAKSSDSSPAAKATISAPPADATGSSPPAKKAGAPVEAPPSSVPSAPVSAISAPSPPPKRVSKKAYTKDETAEMKSRKMYIKFVDPSRSRFVAEAGETTTKGGSPKRLHADDDGEEITAKPEFSKKRRTTKKVADPSKEDLEKVRSESLRKRRNLAAAVREDSQRMVSAAQRGLSNVTGVSCYRNSLLQGLLHLPKFFNFLVDQHPVETCVNPRKDCLACSLSHLSARYWTVGSHKKEITAMLRGLEVQCKRLGWNPGPSGQGDPHDQITWMLERISEQITASSVASMQSIMQLVLSSRITCDNCHNVSVGDLQDELALSIPLKPRIRGGSLSSYLHKYLDETIEGYRCEKCKVMGDVHRVQSISHAPDVLFVQLKRFGYDGRKDKLTFPIDHTLDLSPYRDPSGSKDSMVYDLVASVSHTGSLNSGHYTCDARGPDGRWSCFNDMYHSATTLAKALRGNEPYLLFYQRKKI